MQTILVETGYCLKVFFANWYRHAFIFLVFPLVLGLLYGVVYQSFSSTALALDPLTVYFSADGGSAEALQQSITRDMAYVTLTHTAASDIETLVANDTASLGMIITGDNQVVILDNHQKSLEKTSFIYYIEQAVYQLVADPAETAPSRVETIELQPKPRMTSRENMLTSAFTGVSLFLSFTLTGIFLKNREKHVTKRLMSISLSKWQLYAGNAISAFIICLVFGLIYFLISYRLILSLRLNLIALVLAITLQSVFLASVYGFLISVFKDERSMRNITTPFIMAFMFFGGTMFPVDNFKGGNNLARLTPNYLQKNIYENLITTNAFNISPEVITLSVISLGLLIAGAIRFSLREEA